SPESRPTAVQNRQRDLEALSFLSEKILGRNSNVVEVHRRCRGCANAHFVFLRAVRNPSEIPFDDEGRQFSTRALGARENGKERRECAVRYPDLFPIHEPRAVFLFHCRRPDRGGIGTRSRLCETERRDHFAGCELWEIFFLLFIVSEEG